MDKQVLQLFYPHNRETSRGRRLVYDTKQFTKYIERNDGIDDVYVSSYPVNNEHKVTEIDRVIFELDGDLAVHDAKLLYIWSIQNGFSSVPIVSGRKGIHIHVLSKPIKTDNPKEFLTDVSTYILNKSLGVRSWDECKSIDWTIFGNISSLIRVPNTLRPPQNTSYCSFLPHNFVEMSEKEIIMYTKSPHIFVHDMSRNKSFLDLPIDTETELVKSESLITPLDRPHVSSLFKPDDVKKFLSNLLSSKRYTQILQTNPTHSNRIIATLELVDVGLVPEEISYIYSHLGWHDFNESTSQNYVSDLCRRYYNGEYRLRRPE